jgi:hypothetical protein
MHTFSALACLKYTSKMDSAALAVLATQHNPWRAKMHCSVTTAVTSGSAIAFNATDYDLNGNISASTYTIPVDGYYLVTANAQFATTGTWFISVAVGGSAAAYGTTCPSALNNISSVATVLSCVAGQVVSILAGGTGNASGANGATNATFTFLWPA